MFKSWVKKGEGRKDWAVLSFRKQSAVIWGLRWFFFLRRQSGKRQAHWTGLSDTLIQEEGRGKGRSHQQEPRGKQSQDCSQQPRDGSVQTRDSWWPPNVEKRRLDRKLAQQTDGTREKPLQLPGSLLISEPSEPIVEILSTLQFCREGTHCPRHLPSFNSRSEK